MKFLGCFLGMVALLTIVGGAIALATGFPRGSDGTPTVAAIPTDGNEAAVTLTPNDVDSPGTAVAGETPEPDSSNVADPTEPVGAAETPTAVVSNVDVSDPALEVPTFPLASVQATFTEAYEFGLVTVKFRPGTFTQEHAANRAAQTFAAIEEANAKLGTDWQNDITLFLADQLFAEDCLGCQGFTESDFRWIFMLDDGSVVNDEFEALLVHEATHLIAGNEIHLPLDIFYVEGLATWVMTDDLESYGYVTPVQSTAWVYGAGALPSLEQIMEDDFAGRMRKRVYYDAAGAFAFYVIETYGIEDYLALYRQNPIDSVLGKSLPEIEAEWHAYLEPYTGVTVGGVGANEWWDAASQVITAYGRFYEAPSSYTANQYRALTLARLAVNRADTGNAMAFLAESGI